MSAEPQSVKSNVIPIMAPPVQPEITDSRLLGKVRKLKEGYGFIAGDDGKDYFFHWTAMQQNSTDFRNLRVLDRVSFQIIRGGERGDRAIEVSVIHAS